MKILHLFIFITFLLSIFSCTKGVNKTKIISESKKATESPQKDSINCLKNDNKEVVGNINPDFANAYQLNSGDTILVNNYLISFNSIDSCFFPNYYQDQNIRDSIRNLFSNSYKQAIAIEDYLAAKNQNIFERQDSSLFIHLKNNQKLKFLPKDSCVFENYFAKIGFVLLFVQFFEGRGYLLINRENGTSAYLLSPPYFSPNKESFITAEDGLYKGYTRNCISYYTIQEDTIQEVFQFDIKNWGADNIIWKDNNTIQIRQLYELQPQVSDSNNTNYERKIKYVEMQFAKN